jgi:hypothetical protein
MRIERLPDCRPPRRDDSITPASSHPELLTGEIAMRPRVHIPLAPADREVTSVWGSGMLAVCALVAAAVIGYSIVNPSTTTVARDTGEEKQARAETCERHEAAPPDATGNTTGHPAAHQMLQATPACPPATDQASDGRASGRQPQQN